MTTGEYILQILDYVGTSLFALSGCLSGGEAGMDLMGCLLTGIVTAVGGGTARDILLQNKPIFWVHNENYLYIAAITAILTFFLYPLQNKFTSSGKLLFWADSICIAAFGIIAVRISSESNLPLPLTLLFSFVTCSVGGITRDVLTQKPVRIMFNHLEVYSIISTVASSMFLLGEEVLHLSLDWNIILSMFVCILVRYFTARWGIRFPTMMQQKTRTITLNEELLSDKAIV